MIKRKLYRNIVLPLIRWSRKISLPGFKKVSIYHIGKFIYSETQKDDIMTRANSIAFSFFISLFPTIIFFFTLIPHLPIRFDVLDLIATNGAKILPKEAFDYLMEIVNSVVSIKRGGLLSAGFFLAIFFSSSGMLTLMYGFDKSYDLTFKKRSYFKKRFIALMLTIILSFIFLMSLILIVFGSDIVSALFDHKYLDIVSAYAIAIFRWLTILLLLYTSISLIYRFGPSMYRKISYINAGSTLATTLSIVSSLAFAYFINNFGQYNKLYGSIGALIVLLLWLQINAFNLLIGFELNASIAVNNDIWNQSKKKTNLSKRLLSTLNPKDKPVK